MFFWGNTYNGAALDPWVDDSGMSGFIQLNRNYWNHAPDASSGKITWSDWPGSHNAVFNAGVAQAYYPYTPLVYPHPIVTLQGSGSTTNPPSITSQPTGLTNAVGAAWSLTVTATGTAPITFQWQRGGAEVQTSTTVTNYSVGAGATNQNGQYRCVLTNVAGAVTSAVVSVLFTNGPPPAVVTVPPPWNLMME
jgi:hypothetical protein